jgi:hypothetical protein
MRPTQIAALGGLLLAVSANALRGGFSSEDAAVLKAALEETCHDQKILIQGDAAEVSELGAGRPRGISREVWKNLVQRNHRAETLPLGDICAGAIVVSKPEVETAFAVPPDSGPASLDSGWRRLFKAFPGSTALVRMSLPGYSNRGDLAAVYLVVGSGSLRGAAHYILLRKGNNRWRTVGKKLAWVA